MVSQQQGIVVAYANHTLCIEGKELYLQTMSTDLSRVTQAGDDQGSRWRNASPFCTTDHQLALPVKSNIDYPPRDGRAIIFCIVILQGGSHHQVFAPEYAQDEYNYKHRFA